MGTHERDQMKMNIEQALEEIVRCGNGMSIMLSSFEDSFARGNPRTGMIHLNKRGSSAYADLDHTNALHLRNLLNCLIAWQEEHDAVGPDIEADEEEAYRQHSHVDVDARIP